MTDTMRVEEARRVLAQFDAEARAQAEAREREIAAEHARQTARRRRWAETYEPTAAADLAEAHAARHAARAAFLDGAQALIPAGGALIRYAGGVATLVRDGDFLSCAVSPADPELLVGTVRATLRCYE